MRERGLIARPDPGGHTTGQPHARRRLAGLALPTPGVDGKALEVPGIPMRSRRATRGPPYDCGTITLNSDFDSLQRMPGKAGRHTW